MKQECACMEVITNKRENNYSWKNMNEGYVSY